MNTKKAEVAEIFSSIQGEGIFLGARQIFVRFRKCNMACVYCDEIKNPVSKEYTPIELMGEVKFLELSKGPHHSVSLTGGEPLLYAEFLKPFLKLLKKEALKAYLETNGTLPDELRKVVDLVDIVAMDFKPPSSTLDKAFWNEHLRFLKIATRAKVFVKVVVTPKTLKRDIERSVEIIKKVRGDIPLILQPASPVKPSDRDVSKDAMLRFMEVGFRRKIDNIRVIPQIHKMLNMK